MVEKDLFGEGFGNGEQPGDGEREDAGGRSRRGEPAGSRKRATAGSQKGRASPIARGTATTPPPTSRCWRGLSRSAAALACTSAGTDVRALHHLFAEVLDNAMDEAVAGHANVIEVRFGKDGLTVSDNGRGNSRRGASALSGEVGAGSHHDDLARRRKVRFQGLRGLGRPPRRRRLRGERAVGRADRRGRARQEALPPELFTRGADQRARARWGPHPTDAAQR